MQDQGKHQRNVFNCIKQVGFWCVVQLFSIISSFFFSLWTCIPNKNMEEVFVYCWPKAIPVKDQRFCDLRNSSSRRTRNEAFQSFLGIFSARSELFHVCHVFFLMQFDDDDYSLEPETRMNFAFSTPEIKGILILRLARQWQYVKWQTFRHKIQAWSGRLCQNAGNKNVFWPFAGPKCPVPGCRMVWGRDYTASLCITAFDCNDSLWNIHLPVVKQMRIMTYYTIIYYIIHVYYIILYHIILCYIIWNCMARPWANIVDMVKVKCLYLHQT